MKTEIKYPPSDLLFPLFSYVCCQLSVVYCVLSTVCCLSYAVYCLLFLVCCAVYCILSVVYRLLSIVCQVTCMKYLLTRRRRGYGTKATTETNWIRELNTLNKEEEEEVVITEEEEASAVSISRFLAYFDSHTHSSFTSLFLLFFIVTSVFYILHHFSHGFHDL